MTSVTDPSRAEHAKVLARLDPFVDVSDEKFERLRTVLDLDPDQVRVDDLSAALSLLADVSVIRQDEIFSRVGR